MSKDRAEEYADLVSKALQRLGDDPDRDEVAARYASLVMASKTLTARMIADPQRNDAETLLRLDESIRSIFPPTPHKVKITIVDPIPSGRMPDLPSTGPANPLPRPPTTLEASQQSLDQAAGRGPHGSATPPQPVPALDFAPYNPAFHSGNSKSVPPLKSGTGVAADAFMGVFKPAAPDPFPTAHKPRADGTV
jgi:hypothetical protein